MQLSAAQLPTHLNKGLKGLYTLHGDEPLLIQEALDAIRAAARAQGFTERSSHTVSGANFDWSEVLAAGGSLSLFADKQILELRIPSGKPGKDGSPALQQLAVQSVGNVAEGVYSARTVVQRAQMLGVHMPIAESVVALLDGHLEPQAAVLELMGRGPVSEQG